jgi:hypothetical protein
MDNFVGRRTTLAHLRRAPWLMFLGSFGLAVVGFTANRTWTNIPWNSVAVLAGLALLSMLVAFVLQRLTGAAPATSAAAVWLIALVYFAGASSSTAVVLLALAAMALGSIAIPEGWSARVALSTLSGFALISGVAGWLLPFPVHYRALYLVVLLAVVFIRWRAVGGLLHSLTDSWRVSIAESPAIAWLAVMVIGVVSTCAWMPPIRYDDLAYHIGLPSQLVSLGYYQMNAATNLWAVSAWAADVLQGITWLIAGNESRGVLDVLWLLLTLVLIWRLSEAIDLPPWARWLAVALYASLPMTAGTLGGMQTEGPSAAVAVAIALLIRRSPGPGKRQFVAIVLLFGLLLALKVSNLMVAGPLGLWLLCRWRAHLPWRVVPSSLLLLLLVAGSSYIYAWALTGNPVLPVFNGIFHSPYYAPVNFHDKTWNEGFQWDILWKLVFHTSRYIEGGDGAAGFVIIALGGSLVVALFEREVRPLALVALGAFFLPLTQLQYLRYTHPAFALLIPAMLRGVPWLASGSRFLRAGMASIWVLVLTNLLFISSGSWQLQNGALWTFLTDARQFMSQYAPIYRMMDLVKSRYGASARVLISSTNIPFAAGFGGKAFVVSWYDQELVALAARANRDPSGAEWTKILDYTGVNLLILQSGQVSRGLAAAIETSHGRLVYQGGGAQLWEVRNEVAGTSQPGSDGSVSVKFDISALPLQPMLAHAQLVIRCVPQAGPIALGWGITEQEGEVWSDNEWTTCLPDGSARASLDVSMPRQIHAFTVSAKQARSALPEQAVVWSSLYVRKDLSAERDLAQHMRTGLLRAVASWLDPWRAHRIVREGVSMPSPADTVKVKFDTTMAPHQASFVRAKLDLKCNDKGVPIVIGWTREEAGGEPLSAYEWATCGTDGVAHASFNARATHRVMSLTVTAASSSKAIDMGLQISNAEVAYLPNKGASGLIVRKRIKWAKRLSPHTSIQRLDP